MDVYETIGQIKLVPVTVFKSLDDVRPTLDALNKGNVPVTEICFRTECAKEAIKIARKEFPDMLVGAGTVINANQCKDALEAGAMFIVSPGFSDEVLELCILNNIPYIPGVVTPTEIMRALENGLNILKFFPADVFEGLKAIKALSSAFPQVQFMPTGGVSNENLKEFISNKAVFACGGSWLVKGTPEEITKTCLEATKIVKGE